MKPAGIAFFVSLLLAIPPAAAQPDEEEVELGEDLVEPTPDSGEEVELGDGETPSGTDENPNAPRGVGMEQRTEKKSLPAGARGPYPMELASRPLTLNAGMSEVYFEIPTNFDPFYAAGTLRGSYGVNNQTEISLRYGLGAIDQDGNFTEGKAIGIDAVYLFTEKIGVQVSIPLLLDPFALGLTLGVPVRWQPYKKLAFVVGRDMFNIKLNRFVPDVDNAAVNAALIAMDDTNTTMPKGDIRLLLGVIYQQSPNMAILAETGFIGPDFGMTDAGYPLTLSLVYSTNNKLDFGGRFGFTNLDEASKHVGLALFFGLRL